VIRILIVDDEPEISGTLSRALAQYSCKCLTVRTALGAIRAMKSDDFDAMLLDINLGGGLSGIELAQKVRRGNTAIKILVFSALHHGPEIQREIDALGAIFFEKPVSAKAIYSALQNEVT
jgi:DNA-binding response OmpR family regulator